MNVPSPTIGEWYQRLAGNDAGALFEVVAVDAEDDSIELQHFDGTLEELDFATWREQLIQEADAPEDWTGSVDVAAEDVDEDVESNGHSTGQTDPISFLDSSEASGFSEWPTPMDERFD